LIAHFVTRELERRRALGRYNGKFNYVTHFFGFQGRAAHPSAFDCSLGSSLGYGAACLLDAGLSNVAVSITDPTNKPS